MQGIATLATVAAVILMRTLGLVERTRGPPGATKRLSLRQWCKRGQPRARIHIYVVYLPTHARAAAHVEYLTASLCSNAYETAAARSRSQFYDRHVMHDHATDSRRRYRARILYRDDIYVFAYIHAHVRVHYN